MGWTEFCYIGLGALLMALVAFAVGYHLGYHRGYEDSERVGNQFERLRRENDKIL